MSKNVYTYEGEAIDVHWDRRLCIHVGECGRAVGDLFVGGRDPWCSPDVTSVEDVIAVVERCPTGALTYTAKDGSAEQTPATNTAMIANHGPIYLTGDLQIDGAADDMSGVSKRVALCRCGQSKNKPFCDNSHEKAGFQDRGAIGDTGKTIESKGGPLVVKRAKDGPLLVSGNLTMLAASGREAWTGTRCALCRCGASKNKPFCDGSHKAAGFEAE